MAIAIKLPDMGTNVEECRVQSWRVQEGERVRRGMVLAEIETDKAVAELESSAEGVLLKQAVPAGGVVAVGDVLAYVGHPGEEVPNLTVPAATSIARPTTASVASVAPQAVKASPEAKGPAPISDTPVRVSPVVRNLAAKLGVDLRKVRGTGPGGMITREDVLRARGE